MKETIRVLGAILTTAAEKHGEKSGSGTDGNLIRLMCEAKGAPWFKKLLGTINQKIRKELAIKEELTRMIPWGETAQTQTRAMEALLQWQAIYGSHNLNRVKIGGHFYTIGGAVATQKEAGKPIDKAYYPYTGLAGIYSDMIHGDAEQHLCLLESHHRDVIKSILYNKILPDKWNIRNHGDELLTRDHLTQHQLKFFKYNVIDP